MKNGITRVGFACAGVALLWGAGFGEAFDMTAIFERVDSRNSELKAARGEVEAAASEIDQAGLLPNPELEIGTENLGMAEAEVVVSQPLELGGKRKSRVAAAKLGREEAELRLAAVRLGLHAEALRRCGELVEVKAGTAVIDTMLALALRDKQRVDRRVEAGPAMELEGIRSQVAVDEIRMQREALLELPGEVGFNEDNLADVTPRYGEILRDVRGRLGQYVKRGQVPAVVENNATLSRYEVKASISGLIIEKHATRGEFASEQSSIYVVANLASVWVNLDVYPRYVENVTVGTGVTIRAVGIDARDSGVVTYVAPVFDKRKRSATARVVVRNRNNRWRPGTFVTATVGIRTDEEVPAVENDAVQALEGGKCLFVPSGEGFKPVLVGIGVRGSDYTEILEGIALNEPYVAKGAFELKAELVTSSLGDHAGHGH